MIVLCATNRPNANSRKVAEHCVELFKKQGVNPTFLDLANLRPDIFDPACYGEKPSWFLEEFQKPISEAKGILVITPEYNGGFPGVMKYFIDMLKFPESLQGVPVAFVGVAAGQFGALRPVEQLEMLFAYRNAHLFGERLFVPKINEALQEDGTLGPVEERLVSLIDDFITFSAAVSG